MYEKDIDTYDVSRRYQSTGKVRDNKGSTYGGSYRNETGSLRRILNYYDHKLADHTAVLPNNKFDIEKLRADRQ